MTCIVTVLDPLTDQSTIIGTNKLVLTVDRECRRLDSGADDALIKTSNCRIGTGGVIAVYSVCIFQGVEKAVYRPAGAHFE